jgi:hypothetical protein
MSREPALTSKPLNCHRMKSEKSSGRYGIDERL